MKIVKSIVFPPFLQRLDERLLLTRPFLWATKLHRVVYLSTLVSVFALVAGMAAPVAQPWRLQSFVMTNVVWIVLMQIGQFIYWLYGSDHYHVEREFGRNRPSPFIEILTTTATILLIGSSLLLFLFTARQRVRSISLEQFATDMYLISAVEHVGYIDGYHGMSSFAEVFETLETMSADILSRDLDTTRFTAIRLRSANFNFLSQYLNLNLLVPFANGIIEGDVTILDELMAHYSGVDVAIIDNVRFNEFGWPFTPVGDYYDVVNEAHKTIIFLKSFAFIPSYMWKLSDGVLILFALGMQFALVRFTFRHAGRTGFVRLLGAVAAVGIVLWITMMMQNAASNLIRGQDYWQGTNRFEENYQTAVMLGGVVFTGLLWMTARRVRGFGRFTWRTAVQVYLLPFALIALPYLLIGILDIQTDIRNGYIRDGFFYRHFLDDSIRNTWTLYPLGNWILYAAQFAWLPAIPFLKKQHVRLLSLPRS